MRGCFPLYPYRNDLMREGEKRKLRRNKLRCERERERRGITQKK